MTRFIVLALLLVGANAIQIVKHKKDKVSEDQQCNCEKALERNLFGKYSGKFYVHNFTKEFPEPKLAEPLLQANKKPVPHLFNQDMYMMDHYIHKRFLEDERRTLDPAEAEFFYIPKLQLGLQGDGGCGPAFMEVMEKVKETCAFKCNNGRDHVVVTPSNAEQSQYEQCFYGNYPDRPEWSLPIIKLDIATRRGSGDTKDGARNHHAMPYESDVHYDASQEDETPPWVRHQDRKGKLVMFAGSEMSKDRATISKECEDAPEICERFRVLSPTPDDKLNVFNLHRNSTFCFEPSGDDPDRRGVWDAMLSGCIPVLTKREDGLHPLNKDYAWYVRKPEEVAIVFDKAEGAVQKLKEVSPEKIAELQANIEKLAPSLQYSMHGKNYQGLPDAFDLMVQKVQGIVRDVKL